MPLAPTTHTPHTPTHAELRPLYSHPAKSQQLQSLFQRLAAALAATGAFPPRPSAGGDGGGGGGSEPAPQALLWCRLYQAQEADLLGDTAAALRHVEECIQVLQSMWARAEGVCAWWSGGWVGVCVGRTRQSPYTAVLSNPAAYPPARPPTHPPTHPPPLLQHTPTLPEAHVAKARALKHAGDLEGAARTADAGARALMHALMRALMHAVRRSGPPVRPPFPTPAAPTLLHPPRSTHPPTRAARRMDLADRYLNCVATKALLRAGHVSRLPAWLPA